MPELTNQSRESDAKCLGGTIRNTPLDIGTEDLMQP